MAIASNLGFSRIGAHRELKKALENYWSGKSNEEDLLATGRLLRREHWLLQQKLGLQHIPSNDFSFYDHVLDAACMVGAVPSRYGSVGQRVDLPIYFRLARGVYRDTSLASTNPAGARAMEMTKWFDTNYHYIVPEFEAGQHFRLTSVKPVDEFLEARALGIQSRPVLLGPLSFLFLGKSKSSGRRVLSLLGQLLPVYVEIINRLEQAGADWVQLDEPILALDLPSEFQNAFASAYDRIGSACGLHVLITTYFDGLKQNLDYALQLPVAAIHLDFVRAPEQLKEALRKAPRGLKLSLGLVDGRNIWRTDLDRALSLAEQAVENLGAERVLIAPSCSLLHSPIDLQWERGLDDELRSWLAFAKQKIEEVVVLTRAVNEGRASVRESLERNREAIEKRRRSPRVHDGAIQQRASGVTPEMLHRRSAYEHRHEIQQQALQLPLLPTTTIGSFPQTKEIRAARAGYKAGKTEVRDYKAFLRAEIEKAIRFQEEIDLDVLAHGEFERGDMVEFFGEQLTGFTTTENGWVQSYGSRCVKPPIIYGDVTRLKPVTLEWSQFAQSLTSKPVKGMLTGPVTVLQWSFVRDDQPRESTCRQIALAIRDEAGDLEAAGIRAIQIDEPAFREGLPLRRSDQTEYLKWAVEAFRLASSGVRDETQIHTHMCYSEFNDIIDAVAAMDADIISIESSRSEMELLEAFTARHYPNGIGPGVYDVHSPRVPTTEEMQKTLEKILRVLSPSQVWVNPDCGLKTRRWEEVRPALTAMVDAARHVRQALSKGRSDQAVSSSD